MEVKKASRGEPRLIDNREPPQSSIPLLTIALTMSKSAPPPPGIYVPAVLFFDEHEEFDVPAIKAHVLRLAQGGVTGILVQGSNGEAQHL